MAAGLREVWSETGAALSREMCLLLPIVPMLLGHVKNSACVVFVHNGKRSGNNIRSPRPSRSGLESDI